MSTFVTNDPDFEIPAPDGLANPHNMNIDEAVEIVCELFGWPKLGGPSGRGWSFFSVAQLCGRLFYKTYDAPDRDAPKVHATPLQVGSLYHTLHALYYGAGLGENALVLPNRGGLIAPDYATRVSKRSKRWTVPPMAADELLAELKRMARVTDVETNLRASLARVKNGKLAKSPRAPSINHVLEAERLFDAHTNFWGNGNEDVEPLAVEFFAAHPTLQYTCRYDMIARVGPNDRYVAKPGVYIVECKSAAWMDEKLLEAWQMDGEVLGQILCWEPSGCAELFGPLEGVIVDIVSKSKVPECRRVIVPSTVRAVGNHARWIGVTNAQIAMWRATGVYPQSFANCHRKYGRCENWDNCVLGA